MESLTTTSSTTTTTNDDNDDCTHCRHKLAQQAKTIEQLRTELKAKDEAFERLQQDIHTLNRKYVAQIERVADVQHEKALVEHELEELSTRLFEEANGMVAEEKRQRYLLEQQLRHTQEHLIAEQSQLQELRERIEQLPQHQQHDDNSGNGDNGVTNTDPNMARARHDLQQLYNCKRASANNHHMYYSKIKRAGGGHGANGEQQQQLQQRTTSMPPLPSVTQQQQQKKQMSIDQIQLEAFREFVRASPNTPFKKLNQFMYMKVCQQEDVEPCLRFGPHSRLSVKKMNEYLSRQPCFIEQLDEESQKTMTINTNVLPSAVMTRPLWERFSSSSSNNNSNNNHSQHHQQCSACGRPADQQGSLLYRFRLDESDDWAAIDQYCRDRLVAVCEFYVFIRNVQKGFYADREIDDLYTENIRLRLQMFYSRMGALPVVLDGIGLDPGAVGKASPPLDTIPDDDNDDDDDASDYASMSSGPRTPIQQTPPILKEEYDENTHHHVDGSVGKDQLENNHTRRQHQHQNNNNSNNDNDNVNVNANVDEP